jgi:hypothetical protein
MLRLVARSVWMVGVKTLSPFELQRSTGELATPHVLAMPYAVTVCCARIERALAMHQWHGPSQGHDLGPVSWVSAQ